MKKRSSLTFRRKTTAPPKILIINTIIAIEWGVSLLGQPTAASARTAVALDDISKATLYLDASSPASVKRAAEDMQNYVQQVTGARLRISTDASHLQGYVIYLGDTSFARAQGIKTHQLPPDGFRILANKKWIVIAGRDHSGPPLVGFNNPYRINESYNSKLDISVFGDTGTLYGVYYFLEKYCGVRWYMPGELGTVISRRGKIAVPVINLQRSPAFEQRHAYYSLMDSSDDDALWYRRAGYGSTFPVQVSHSFGYFFLHYKDTHPEYFAIINGKRDFSDLSTSTGGGNYNLSNPAFVQQVIADVIKYFDDNPGQKIFPLCPNDGMRSISEDPVSQAQIDHSRGESGKFSNYIWGFIDKVARGVAKKYPDRLIGCIAYEHYTLPPTNIDRFSPNVAVMLTKFRASYPDAKIKRETEASIREWSKKARVLYTWEYNCNPLLNPAWSGYPMFFPKILQDDLKFQKGVSKGEFIEAESWTPEHNALSPKRSKINFPGTQHPQLYLNARLLWDPDLNVKKTLAEYYKLFYGPAEKPMRAYWELVESNWNKKSWHVNPLEVYDIATLSKLLDYMKQARALCTPNTLYRQRVELIYSEFSPAAEAAVRLSTLAKPHLQIPPAAGLATRGAEAPTFKGGTPPIHFLDRKYNISSPATDMRLAWDAQNLYIELLCAEPNMTKLKSLASGRDSMHPPIWEDDAVELFLTPAALSPADKPQTLHLIVTAGGALYDSKIPQLWERADREWNGNARVTVAKSEKGWSARLAIPWNDLAVSAPEAGQQLSANFYRSRYAGGTLEQSSWSPLQDGRYYWPQYFGQITLAK